MRRSTIAGNTAPLGGGVYADSAMALLDHVKVAINLGADGVHNQAGLFTEVALLANNAGGHCSGFGAFNLDDANTCGPNSIDFPNFPNTDPLLGTLGNNGGPTPTPAPGDDAGNVQHRCPVWLDASRDGCLGRGGG